MMLELEQQSGWLLGTLVTESGNFSPFEKEQNRVNGIVENGVAWEKSHSQADMLIKQIKKKANI